MTPQHREKLLFVVAIAVFSAVPSLSEAEQRESTTIKLNMAAFQYARELIQQGSVVSDHKGWWRYHQLSAEQKNEFIRAYGFAEYAKWHLAIDDQHGANTKARYKFPYGDMKSVHRCALLAVKNRARQCGYDGIEAAAHKLLGEIDVRAPKR